MSQWVDVATIVALASVAGATASEPVHSPRVPDVLVDLTTQAGLGLVGGQWRVADAPLSEFQSTTRAGQSIVSHDMMLRAGETDFDDTSWTVLQPEHVHTRLGGGRVSFAWYRTSITLPDRIGDQPIDGCALVLNTTVDDYAEVWVDGQLPIVLGQTGGAAISGWNAPSRVLLTKAARAGQRIQVAIFAINGPLSTPPENRIWLRSATLDVYAPGRLNGATVEPLKIVPNLPELDGVLGPHPTLERLATGFVFTEGPVWMNGDLLFSDPNQNVIHRLNPITGDVSVYMANSGFAGGSEQPWGGHIRRFGQPGSNGLAIDRQGRLTICQHGLRRVVRIEPHGDVTVLADRFEGKRLNSPNDCVYRSDGLLFFTDPPFGLPKYHDDPACEQRYCGVYCVQGLEGGTTEVRQVGVDLRGPNGLAFSPDERVLYVSNWDEQRKVIMRYDCAPDGSLSGGRELFSMQNAPEPEALDGLKVDSRGNIFASGPGGVWIIDPSGRHLGTLMCPELPANMTWGDGGADGGQLYFTARTSIYRLTLKR